jgi:ComF family protein
MSLRASLADLILAPTCLGCRGLIATGDSARLVCRRCRTMVVPPPAPVCPRCGATRLATGREWGPAGAECEGWPAHVRAARAAALMQPPANVLIHALKYHGWRAVADYMGERMAGLDLPADVDEEARTCVPVPSTAGRLRERGYNQADLLANAFARRTGRSVRPLLTRQAAATTQTALQPVARGANVAGTFRVNTTEAIAWRGAHILLVDDVLTTGATALECAAALAGAGIRCVTVITFARALDARRLTQT